MLRLKPNFSTTQLKKVIGAPIVPKIQPGAPSWNPLLPHKKYPPIIMKIPMMMLKIEIQRPIVRFIYFVSYLENLLRLLRKSI